MMNFHEHIRLSTHLIVILKLAHRIGILICFSVHSFSISLLKEGEIVALYDVLKSDIQRMIHGVGNEEKGNIHPLIMQEVEKYLIKVVLEETRHNYVRAARVLGIGRSTLYRKIEFFALGKKGECKL